MLDYCWSKLSGKYRIPLVSGIQLAKRSKRDKLEKTMDRAMFRCAFVQHDYRMVRILSKHIADNNMQAQVDGIEFDCRHLLVRRSILALYGFDLISYADEVTMSFAQPIKGGKPIIGFLKVNALGAIMRHELIHHDQWLRGDLSTSTEGKLTFKGIEYNYDMTKPKSIAVQCAELPYELEAYGMMYSDEELQAFYKRDPKGFLKVYNYSIKPLGRVLPFEFEKLITEDLATHPTIDFC
jgi:hypothetical protein